MTTRLPRVGRSSRARTTGSAPPPRRPWPPRASPSLCAYFRNERLGGLDDPSLPAAYRATRMARADFVAESIRAAGGRAVAVEADLSDAASVPALFDAAEAQFGPVQILVNNASGWVADTFVPAATDRFGRAQAPVSAAHGRPGARRSTPGRPRS